jgi:hypothetical protein
MTLAKPSAVCALVEQKGRQRGLSLQPELDQSLREMENAPSDRSQAIGRKLLVGQLAPWVTGHLGNLTSIINATRIIICLVLTNISIQKHYAAL